jgi:putative peptidoglycan lipid II flippase
MNDGMKPISFWNRRHTLKWAALIMGMSILLSRFMGLIRDQVISRLFGATTESDIYFAAFVIPDFLNYLLAGAYFSITLIPLLAAYFERDENDGWRFLSSVVTWTVVAITTLTMLAMAAAPALARFAAPGLTPTGWARLTLFLRIILPAQIFFLAGSCVTALLYQRKQFLVPALCPIIYNGLIILGGILLRRRGMEGFCWGVLVGAAAGNFLLPWIAARRSGGLKLRPVFRHPGLRPFVLLALPLMIGQSIVVWDEQLARIFGSLAGAGAVSWLNYARRVMLVPVGVVAQAAGVASFPFLAELVARSDHARFNETLNTALRNTLVLLVPVSIWMIAVSEPVVQLVFQQGRFGPGDTAQTHWLLRIYLLGALAWGSQQILGRAFYAHRDTLTPAMLGTIATLASLPLYALGAAAAGARGVAAAGALSVLLYAGLMLWRWQRRHGREALSGLIRPLLSATAISLVSAAPAAAVPSIFLSRPGVNPVTAALAAIIASGTVFALVFLGLCRLLAPDLIRRRRPDAGEPE